MKDFLLTTTLIFLFASNAFSQINKMWHFASGSTGTDRISKSISDASGNVYVTGMFYGTVDFDPSATTYNLSTPFGRTNPDAFIQKLDANGNLLWVKQYGGSLDGIKRGIDLAVDDSNNVYLLGTYMRDIQLMPNGPLWVSGSGGALERPFVVKLDSTGNERWGLGWTNNNTGHESLPVCIVVDQNYKVYVGGLFEGTMDFDPTMNSTLNHTATATSDAFLMRIGFGGVLEKVRTFGGTSGRNSVNSITLTPQGELLMVGIFENTVDFNNGPGIFNLISAGGWDNYVTKTDTAFNHIWAKSWGGSGSSPGLDEPFAVVLKGSSIYCTGVFNSTVDFDPSSATFNITSSGNSDAYILKLDLAGNFKWAYKLGGAAVEIPYAMDVSPSENILIVGKFAGTSNFSPKGGTFNLTSNGGDDAFVVLLDSAANLVHAVQFGGTGNERFITAEFVNDNDFYVGSRFENTVDIDPTVGVENITSAGSTDMLLLKLNSCNFTYTTFSETACGSYAAPSGSAIYTSSGTYNDTISSQMGCDSILTINLTILPALNPTVTQTNAGLEATATGSNFTYKWINCATNQLVSGATNQTFMPATNGSYAVIVNDGVCTDTSACFSINNVAINEATVANLKIYPNPTTGILRIDSHENWQKLEVTDLLGRVVKTCNSSASEIDLNQLPSGVYLVRVYFKDGIVVQRVVKE